MRRGALSVRLAIDPPGIVESPAPKGIAIAIHAGPSVRIGCRRGGDSHRGLAVHGDIDIIPPGMPSRWEVEKTDTALLIGVRTECFRAVVEERGLDPRRVEILNRFQMRDPQIEHIGWALKAQMDAPDGLFTESLATALAVRILERHSNAARIRDERMSISGRRLRAVLGYIEDHLVRELSLSELASVAGMGVSQFKKVFRESTGVPVHRYVIERRVERAKNLLREGRLSVAQIALESGFAHQSHLARHFRRITGASPRELRGGYRE